MFIVDEVPHQFQVRNINFETTIDTLQTNQLQYTLKPNKRGQYKIGVHQF